MNVQRSHLRPDGTTWPPVTPDPPPPPGYVDPIPDLDAALRLSSSEPRADGPDADGPDAEGPDPDGPGSTPDASATG